MLFVSCPFNILDMIQNKEYNNNKTKKIKSYLLILLWLNKKKIFYKGGQFTNTIIINNIKINEKNSFLFCIVLICSFFFFKCVYIYVIYNSTHIKFIWRRLLNKKEKEYSPRFIRFDRLFIHSPLLFE